MAIRFLFLQQLVREKKLIALRKVPSEANRADVLTKAVKTDILEKLRASFGLQIVVASSLVTSGAGGRVREAMATCTLEAEPCVEFGWVDLIVAMGLGIFLGMVCGFVLAKRFWTEAPTETEVPTEKKEKSIQGPVTYTSLRGVACARYFPLGETAWGAWP